MKYRSFVLILHEVKKSFHKIVSLTMALLVLFSTMSFSMNMHYCGDKLVDFKIMKEAVSCGMDLQQTPNNCENTITTKSCCSDKTVVVKGHDDLKSSFDSLSLEHQTFVAAFVYTYVNLFEGLDEQIIPFKDYSPPVLIKDIQLLDQTFLI